MLYGRAIPPMPNRVLLDQATLNNRRGQHKGRMWHGGQGCAGPPEQEKTRHAGDWWQGAHQLRPWPGQRGKSTPMGDHHMCSATQMKWMTTMRPGEGGLRWAAHRRGISNMWSNLFACRRASTVGRGSGCGAMVVGHGLDSSVQRCPGSGRRRRDVQAV